MFLKQSTAQTIRFGPFLDDTDFKTAETALTIAQADRQISKDGGAFAQSNHTGNSTHDTDGWYSDDLDATDTNTVGILKLQVVVAGALPVWETFYVVEEAVYDAMYGASAAGPLQATTAGRTLDLTASNKAEIDLDSATGTLSDAQVDTLGVNVTHWVGVPQVAPINGRPTVHVGEMANNTVTAAAIAANAIGSSEIANDALTAAKFAANSLDGKGDWNIGKTGYALSAAGVDAIWDEAQAGHTTAGTFGKFLDVEVSSVSGGGGLTQQDVADAMRLAPAGTVNTDSVDDRLTKTQNQLATNVPDIISLANIAASVWDRLTSALTVASSIGKLLVDNINDTISSRSSHSAADVWAVGTRTITGGTIDTNNDKTGYALTAAERDAIADAHLDLAAAIEGFTPREAARLILASQVGNTTGMGGTTGNIRDVGNTKNRVTATIDADGNRTVTARDAT